MKMRKLMFVFAITMIAGITQAASVSWQLGTKNAIKDSSGAQLSASLTVYLFNTGATDYSKTVAGLADGSITAANISSAKGYLGSAATRTTNTTWGKTQTPEKADSASIVAGNSYSLVFVAFEGSKYYLSEAKSASGWDGSEAYPSATATPASWSSTDFSTANWHTTTGGGGGVPEPTSGLLLVLGGAMLALRRKQK